MDFETMVYGPRLQDALKVTAHAADKSGERPVLAWHWFTPADGGIDIITADNHRLGCYHVECERPSEAFAIDAPDIAVIIKWLAKRDEVRLVVADRTATLSDRDDSIAVRLCEGKCPDWTAVTGRDITDPRHIGLQAGYLGEAGRAIASSKYLSPHLRVMVSGDASDPVSIQSGLDESPYREWVMPELLREQIIGSRDENVDR